MPCELIMRGGFQPRRINQRWDTTILNLTQAINNGTVFIASNDLDTGAAVATRVSDIIEVVDIPESEED